MSNQPEMAPETEVRALSTLWKVQVNAGNDERAQVALDRVHYLQWEIGRAKRS